MWMRPGKTFIVHQTSLTRITCSEFTGKHKHEGEETDFDECFFFPEWKGKNTAAAVSSQ